MKKLPPFRKIINPFLICFITICLCSCIKSKNYYNSSILDKKITEKRPVINFKSLDSLDESNRKTIELSSILFDTTEDVKTLQLLASIRKNHEKINLELNNLTNKNLIIIPKLAYHTDIKHDCVKSVKNKIYLLKTLETELKNQITTFEGIEKTSQNIDFRIFAMQSKKAIENNNKVLKTIIQNHSI
jgi:hypothetical protein